MFINTIFNWGFLQKFILKLSHILLTLFLYLKKHSYFNLFPKALFLEKINKYFFRDISSFGKYIQKCIKYCVC